MVTYNRINNTVSETYFQPLKAAFEQITSRRCPVLSDWKWVVTGVSRVVRGAASGREFLQYLSEVCDQELGVSHFFESLKSQRRKNMVVDLNGHVLEHMKIQCPDVLECLDSMSNFDLYAADGHAHAASTHSAKMEGTKWAAQYIYALNLRTHAMSLLSLPDPGAKKEHEIKTMKKLEVRQLRQNAPKGRKVLYVYDRAGIDIQWWAKCKQHGIYFISRKKDNMNGSLTPMLWDQQAGINLGVQAQGELFTSQGLSLRCVNYIDPLTGKSFSFITNLPYSIPPGVIAHLYRMRWDIEETFHTFKQAMSETKAWAKSPVARQMQANFMCLCHNLTKLMELHLKTHHQIENVAELKRKNKLHQPNLNTWPMLRSRELRIIRISVKFIRWLRHHLHSQRPYNQALDSLRSIYAKI